MTLNSIKNVFGEAPLVASSNTQLNKDKNLIPIILLLGIGVMMYLTYKEEMRRKKEEDKLK